MHRPLRELDGLGCKIECDAAELQECFSLRHVQFFSHVLISIHARQRFRHSAHRFPVMEPVDRKQKLLAVAHMLRKTWKPAGRNGHMFECRHAIRCVP
jgi:hypothetical protein